MMQMKLLMNALSDFVQDIQEIQKQQLEELILFLIQFNLCITYVVTYVYTNIIILYIKEKEILPAYIS